MYRQPAYDIYHDNAQLDLYARKSEVLRRVSSLDETANVHTRINDMVLYNKNNIIKNGNRSTYVVRGLPEYSYKRPYCTN